MSIGTALLSITLGLSCSAAVAEGLVLVPASKGGVEFQRKSAGFTRHFGEGGIPVSLREESVGTKLEDIRASEAGEGPSVPQEVLDAIEETALRYGRHAGLKAAGLSETEWMMLFRALIEVESHYDPLATSDKGAIGLGQLLPGTAADLGVDAHDPLENLDGAARYFLALLDEFQSVELAVAGYNAGPQAVADTGGIPPYEETQSHVRKVMDAYSRLNQEGKS
jgi:hypothetical protein